MPNDKIGRNTLHNYFHIGEEIFIKTMDNELLDCYWLPQINLTTSPTVLYLIGNAGSIHDRANIIKNLYEKSKLNIFALSYRGYGRSTGIPNELGLKEDVKTGIDYILNMKNIDKFKIYIYGQSLGGACTISLLEQYFNYINGIIIENCFLSIPKIINDKIYYINNIINKFIKDKWNNELILEKINNKKELMNIKILLLSAKNDEIVPRYHMEKLCIDFYNNIYNNKNIFFISFDNCGHNNTWLDYNYFYYIFVFTHNINK
eukprot:GHVP01018842.1.p1 GENE.GHVP01018842.1~~GHVP01018842.1.p1  ORF type:complete len:271 (-),score=34.83 GHVP01018842.1:455-1237(-)